MKIRRRCFWLLVVLLLGGGSVSHVHAGDRGVTIMMIKATNEDMTRMRQQINDFEEQLEQRKSSQGNEQKYEVLFKRDKEMSEFISKFDERKAEELKNQRESQALIVQLLEHMMAGKRIINVDEAILPQAAFVRRSWGIAGESLR